MSESKYSRFLIQNPLYEPVPEVKDRQSPAMTFLSSRQVPEANYYLQLGWVCGVPQPNPYIPEHVHDYDEILLHWGRQSGKAPGPGMRNRVPYRRPAGRL